MRFGSGACRSPPFLPVGLSLPLPSFPPPVTGGVIGAPPLGPHESGAAAGGPSRLSELPALRVRDSSGEQAL